MLRKKTLMLFLLIAVIIYGFLSVPLTVFDEAYGSFYRKVAGTWFSTFRETGFVQFHKIDDPAQSQVYIGNKTQIDAQGHFNSPLCYIGTRRLGYYPTILLISLVLASPVPWKRKLFALVTGLILLMLLIIFVLWIILLWNCEAAPWLQLTDFTSTGKKLLTFAYDFFVSSFNALSIFVVVIWLLVTFRVEDFRAMPTSAGKNGSTNQR